MQTTRTGDSFFEIVYQKMMEEMEKEGHQFVLSDDDDEEQKSKPCDKPIQKDSAKENNHG